MTPRPTRHYAIIIPACNEEPCLAPDMQELQETLGDGPHLIAVGVNGSSDRSAEIARECGALVAEVAELGYGHGCKAAVDLVARTMTVDGYLFFAADGANDPRDIAALLAERDRGAELALGCRTRTRNNYRLGNLHYVIANRFFGALCGVLTGRFFADLGPLRYIERDLFHRMQLRELTYGWTIEAQIRAVLLGARITEVPVLERARLAGEQKVSYVSTRQTVVIALKIIAAAWRARDPRRYPAPV